MNNHKLSKDDLRGCIIDGAIPRTTEQRARILIALWEEITGCVWMSSESDINDDSEDYWFDAEDRVVDDINNAIGDLGLTIIYDAGDVIITDVEECD